MASIDRLERIGTGMAGVGRANDERIAFPLIDTKDVFTPRFAAVGNQVDRRGSALGSSSNVVPAKLFPARFQTT